SKSMYNVVNPDSICDTYGADTLRLYEMFLGPIEQSKPWDTKGIDGVNRFLKRLWKMFFGEFGGKPNAEGEINLSDEAPNALELKVLHKLIKKVDDDISNFSYNTSVSAFMIATNELSDLKCNKRAIMEPIIVLLSPFAPHICEELWSLSGHKGSVSSAEFPKYEEKYTREENFDYPVSFNGKTRFKISLAKSLSKEEVEKAVLAAEETAKYIGGNSVKKVIVIPGRIINIVM
ncbi:MAG: class I tRNA ligase family protein, partial [Bacteroidales bacterium]